MENIKFRCHPIMILENAGYFFTVIIVSCFWQLGDLLEEVKDFSGDWMEVLIPIFILITIFVLLVIWKTMAWFKTYISIEENAIIIERKLLTREQNVYGIENIANINMEQNLLERITGTYKIKIDTDSMSTAEKTDISIILGKEKALFFQKEIEKRREKKAIDTGNLITESLEEQGNMEYDLSYSVLDIVMHGVYTVRILPVLYLVAAIVLPIVSGELNLFEKQEGDIVEIIVKYFGVILTLLALLAAAIRSLFGDIVKYFDFRVKRLTDKILIQYGMLKKCQYEVPIERIHAIRIKQTLVSRILKRKYVEIVTVGVGDEENESARLMMAVTDKKLYENMQKLLPEYVLPDTLKLQRQPVAVLWCRFVLTAVFYVAAALIGFLFVLPMLSQVEEIGVIRFATTAGVSFALVMTVLVIVAGYFADGITFSDNSLIVSSGCFEKVINVVPYRDIQTLQLISNPLNRWMGVQKGMLTILAGMMSRHIPIGYYRQDMMEKLVKQFYRSAGVEE